MYVKQQNGRREPCGVVSNILSDRGTNTQRRGEGSLCLPDVKPHPFYWEPQEYQEQHTAAGGCETSSMQTSS